MLKRDYLIFGNRSKRLPTAYLKKDAYFITPNAGVPTSLANMLESTINVVSFGADPSGQRDSCSAFFASANAAKLSVNGGKIEIPPGNYTSSCKWSFLNTNVAIRGSGQSQTRITFTTAGNAGISVAESAIDYLVSVRDLTLVPTTAMPSDVAISIVFPSKIGAGPQADVEHVSVAGSQGAGNAYAYFGKGIYCFSCLGQIIAYNDIQGKQETLATGIGASNMKSGVELGGYSGNGFIYENNIVFADRAINIHGDSEGQRIFANNGVAVNYLVYNDDYDGSLDGLSKLYYPGPEVYSNHCDSYFGCVYVKGWIDGIYTANLFFKRPESTQTWYGYAFMNGAYSNIGGGGAGGSLQNHVSGGTCLANSFQARAGNTFCVKLDWLAQTNLIERVFFQNMSYFDDQTAVSKSGGRSTFASRSYS